MPNLFPVIEKTISNETTASKPIFGKSWRFDFEKGDFVTTSTGVMQEADDLQAYTEWCNKTLRTQRYRYLIYTRRHGQEFEDLIRKNLTRSGYESEIKRMITEALQVDTRTKEVVNFSFKWQENEAYVNFEVISMRGEIVQIKTKVVTG